MQELRCAPRPLTAALGEMLELALEMDVGRYVPASSPTVLYVLRLIARIEDAAELEALELEERAAEEKLRRIAAVVETMPLRCRQVFITSGPT